MSAGSEEEGLTEGLGWLKFLKFAPPLARGESGVMPRIP